MGEQWRVRGAGRETVGKWDGEGNGVCGVVLCCLEMWMGGELLDSTDHEQHASRQASLIFWSENMLDFQTRNTGISRLCATQFDHCTFVVFLAVDIDFSRNLKNAARASDKVLQMLHVFRYANSSCQQEKIHMRIRHTTTVTVGQSC